MWLPETACNEETLEALVEEGVKFILLEPHQAEEVKPLAGGEWRGVGSGQIDPRHAYRCFLKKDPSKHIDIFFYDGPISKSIGFESVLADAKHLMHRIEGAIVDHGHKPQLIHVATDGETYGHHKPFGERSLAYFLYTMAREKGYRVVNYGEYLEENPPAFQVRIKAGENGEGTSWSCAHGVKRWKEHCGCRGGGPGEWTQHWRKPLRDALDWLRDELAKVFEAQGAPYLKDVWEARDDYIHVILDRKPPVVKAFFTRHATHALARKDMTLCLQLLEMQRHAMLMYTSCGWFFTEISGIETVQILQYAARAMQLAQSVSGVNLEPQFLEKLALAKSNVEAYKDGRGVYEQLVKSSIATLEHIVSYYAIGSIFEDYYPHKENLDIYSFNLQVVQQRKESSGNVTLNIGRVKITSKVTLDEKDLIFVAVQIGLYDFRCSVKAFATDRELEKLDQELFDELHTGHIIELFKTLDHYFGEKYFALKDLLLEDRLRIITRLTREQIEKVSKFYERVYDENRKINEIYRSINLPIPSEFRYAAEHVLAKRLMEVLQQLSKQGFPIRRMTAANRIIDAAKSLNVEITKGQITEYLNAELRRTIQRFVQKPGTDLIQECLCIYKLSKRIGIELNPMDAQDDLFQRVRHWRENPQDIPPAIMPYANQFLQLMASLHLSTAELKKLMQKSMA
jgi:alpha-amylase/alpha-mannosidase (GH57 family)